MRTTQPARPSVAQNTQSHAGTILFMFSQEHITIDIYSLKKRFTCNVDQETPMLAQVNECLGALSYEHKVEVLDYRVRILYLGKVYEWNLLAAHKCFDRGSVSETEFAEMIGFVQPNVGRA